MSKDQFLKENQREGEVYAGLVLGQNGGRDYHLFLLPAKTEALTWDKAIEWAESVGGSLPTLQDQAILYGNLKHEFEPRRYWSCQLYENNHDYVMMHNFEYGRQDGYHKSGEYRARVVRRVYL